MHSSHATHVAGIAAGNAGTLAGSVRISGVAPRAYLGNYKVLTVPTDGLRAQRQRTRDRRGNRGRRRRRHGRDQPLARRARDRADARPRRARDRRRRRGGRAHGRGRGERVRPPAARLGRLARQRRDGDQRRRSVSNGRSEPAGAISSFSSAGPTPISLRLKPDVAAPGSSILSSTPERPWSRCSAGRAWPAPHVSRRRRAAPQAPSRRGRPRSCARRS